MTSRLQNLYIARLATQERPCFVCSKFTNVVLTVADNSNNDWFYTCRSHLGSTNFCTKVGGNSPKPTTPSPTTSPRTSNLKDRPAESDSVMDLMSSIGSALTSWRKKPEDEDKEKEKDKDKDKDKNNEKDKDKDDNKTDSSPSTSRPSSPLLTTSPQPQAPPKFILQRDYFYLRQREYTKKQQKKEAEEKLKTLQFPNVPTSLPSSH